MDGGQARQLQFLALSLLALHLQGQICQDSTRSMLAYCMLLRAQQTNEIKLGASAAWVQNSNTVPVHTS